MMDGQNDEEKLSFCQFIILSFIPEALFGCGSAALRLCIDLDIAQLVAAPLTCVNSADGSIFHLPSPIFQLLSRHDSVALR